MQNARLDEAPAGNKTASRNINNFRYADNTTHKAESKEELKRQSLDESERGESKNWLKTQLQKMKITASGSITSWQIDGEIMATETLYLGAPKSLQMVTVAMKLKDTYSLEEKL